MARQKIIVLPSGVEMEFRSLNGNDQGTITKQDNMGTPDSFNEMFSDCVLRIGDNTKVTKRDVESMLSNDRKYGLVELRQFSCRYVDEFVFDYEWPIKGGKKETHNYTVDFSRQTFEMTPYIWVQEEIARLKKEDKQKFDELETSKMYYPVMYASYDEMLKAQLKRDFYTEDKDHIVWQLGNGEQELKFQNVGKNLKDANLKIRMRNPQQMLKKKGAKETIPMVWNFGVADIYDIENFRRAMKKDEGYIDTFLTIANLDDASKTARVDLVSTVDFFFPSQAI